MLNMYSTYQETMEDMMSAKEVAEHYGINYQTVMWAIRYGHLPATNLGKGTQRARWYCYPSDVIFWLNNSDVKKGSKPKATKWFPEVKEVIIEEPKQPTVEETVRQLSEKVRELSNQLLETSVLLEQLANLTKN